MAGEKATCIPDGVSPVPGRTPEKVVAGRATVRFLARFLGLEEEEEEEAEEGIAAVVVVVVVMTDAGGAMARGEGPPRTLPGDAAARSAVSEERSSSEAKSWG